MSVFQCVLHSDQCLNLFDRLELAADKEFKHRKRMSSSVKHVYQSINTVSWSDLFSYDACSSARFAAEASFTSQWCFCSSAEFVAWSSLAFRWCSCSSAEFVTWSSLAFWSDWSRQVESSRLSWVLNSSRLNSSLNSWLEYSSWVKRLKSSIDLKYSTRLVKTWSKVLLIFIWMSDNAIE